MDQIKIGAFIAALRKEQNLTRKQLAEKLNISDKTVSKWECGKGLPEVSLMLPLCEELGITVNELLSGERLEKEDYEGKAEENMLNLMIEGKKNELVLLKKQCRNASILLAFVVFLRIIVNNNFYPYEIMKSICYIGMTYCGLSFFSTFWLRYKQKIDGYSHFLQLIWWPFLFLLFYILKAFFDAIFTGTGRIF